MRAFCSFLISLQDPDCLWVGSCTADKEYVCKHEQLIVSPLTCHNI